MLCGCYADVISVLYVCCVGVVQLLCGCSVGVVQVFCGCCFIDFVQMLCRFGLFSFACCEDDVKVLCVHYVCVWMFNGWCASVMLVLFRCVYFSTTLCRFCICPYVGL